MGANSCFKFHLMMITRVITNKEAEYLRPALSMGPKIGNNNEWEHRKGLTIDSHWLIFNLDLVPQRGMIWAGYKEADEMHGFHKF